MSKMSYECKWQQEMVVQMRTKVVDYLRKCVRWFGICKLRTSLKLTEGVRKDFVMQATVMNRLPKKNVQNRFDVKLDV